MNTSRDIREYIEAIEKLVFEEQLNKENKTVARALLHVHTSKEILIYEDNIVVLSKWFLTLRADYDRLCRVIIKRLKERQARAEARLRPDA
jgi:hypothetical protein